MNLETVLIAVAIMAGVTFLTRLLPFLLFVRHRPPRFLSAVENSIPPMIMVILVLYCLKDVSWGIPAAWLPEMIGIGVVAALHLWKGNALLSVFGGTFLYMVLVQWVFKK